MKVSRVNDGRIGGGRGEEEGWGREVMLLFVNDVASLWKFCQSFCGDCQTAEWGRSGRGEPILLFLVVPFQVFATQKKGAPLG